MARALGLVLLPGQWLAAAPAAADNLVCSSGPAPAAHEEVLQLANRWRARARPCGARGHFAAALPLAWNPTLEAVARRQAAWLAPRRQLSHLGPGGDALGERAHDAGYRFARIAENLARGQQTAERAFEAWAASADHCANLMDPDARDAALACRATADGRPLWVLVLARPR
jgi:uncharacterized protein YkwD